MRYKEDKPEIIKGTITNLELQTIIEDEFEFFDNRTHISIGDIRFFKGALAMVLSKNNIKGRLANELEAIICALEKCGITGLVVER
jgi:hypothetical protein